MLMGLCDMEVFEAVYKAHDNPAFIVSANDMIASACDRAEDEIRTSLKDGKGRGTPPKDVYKPRANPVEFGSSK